MALRHHLTGPLSSFHWQAISTLLCSAFKRIELQARDWSHFERLRQPFEMGSIRCPWLYQFRGSAPSKLIFLKWQQNNRDYLRWSLNGDCLCIWSWAKPTHKIGAHKQSISFFRIQLSSLEAEKCHFVIGVNKSHLKLYYVPHATYRCWPC